MPSFNRVTILAFMFALANWVQVATSAHEIVGDINVNRRQLLGRIELVMFKKITMTISGDSISKWCVQLTIPSSQFDGKMICSIQGISEEFIKSFHPISGQSVMKTTGAYLQRSFITSDLELAIADEASVSIEKLSEDDARYHGRTLDNNNPETNWTSNLPPLAMVESWTFPSMLLQKV
ncbi:unnamed protein product [Pseudo-nitzschia multistriata]|uniref:Uncharacterized protein n=1 Tax=Pseudo-nitzschia multistriata TaxID=183589 RepID=A0A448ZE43_9STRA|nr:unnamed protein product [Pseudo-nitzschia multistriata]